MFGYYPEDFLVGKIRYADIIHPEDLPGVRNEIKTASEDTTQNTIDHEPYRLLTPEGEERWVKITSSIKRGSDGIATHYQGIVEDITSLKTHQDELYRSNILLE